MTSGVLQGRRLYGLVASVALAVLGYLAFSLWGGWHEVGAAFYTVGLGGMVIVLSLSMLNYGLRFLRWQRFLTALGHPMPSVPSGLIYVAGFALTTTPGKAGEMLRGVFLKRHGMLYTQSTAAFLSERLSDLAAIVLLALLGITLYPQGGWLLVIGAAGVVLGLLLLSQAHRFSPWAARLATAERRFARLVHHLLTLLIEARRCHQPILLIGATLLSLAAWSAEAFGFYLVLHWMGMESSLAFAFSVYALAMLAGALSFLPGGLGGAEAVMVGLLLLAGMPESAAVAATVIVRLATLWFAVILGVLTLLFASRPLNNPSQARMS